MQQFCSYSKAIALYLTLISISTAAATPSFLRHFLGSKPAHETLQKIAREADTATGFETPLLKMNRLGKLFGYGTFNWFNTTWINEEATATISDEDIKWQLIHEKWHTLAKHDIRRVIALGYILSSYLVTSLQIGEAFIATGEFPLTPYLLFNLQNILASNLAFLWHEEYCENAADLYADRLTMQKECKERILSAYSSHSYH